MPTEQVKVEYRLVDGSGWTQMREPELLSKLAQLEAVGLRGKALVNALISDDWGPPPTMLVLSWQDEDGRRLERVLPYD